MTDWKKLRDEYVAGSASLGELAQIHQLDVDVIRQRAHSEGWQASRRKVRKRRSDKEVQQRMEVITDRLLDQILQAVGELDVGTVATKTKEKLENGERVTEERCCIPGGKVDVKDLKALTDALRILRDIRFPQTALDIREQEAKIRNLERQLAQQGQASVLVTMDDDMAQLAQ